MIRGPLLAIFASWALVPGCQSDSTGGNRNAAGDLGAIADNDANGDNDRPPPSDPMAAGDSGPGGDNDGCHVENGSRFVPCANAGFIPDTPTTDWRHPSSSIVAMESPRHRGLDLVLNPEASPILIAKFAYGPMDLDVKDETVEVWLQTRCDLWEKLGSALTSDDGQYGTVNGVEDDGGRIFFAIPEAARPGLGSYRVKFLVKADHSEANSWLHVWPRGTHAVLSDVDGTITTSENDGTWSVLDPTAPEIRPHAAETFSRYADKGYRVIYLTARPEYLDDGTRAWFAAHGLPEGVAHFSPKDVGELGNATPYKAAFMTSLQVDAGVVLDAVYGNKDTDLAAYLQAGIPAVSIYLLDGKFEGDPQGANLLIGYGDELARVECLAPLP